MGPDGIPFLKPKPPLRARLRLSDVGWSQLCLALKGSVMEAVGPQDGIGEALIWASLSPLCFVAPLRPRGCSVDRRLSLAPFSPHDGLARIAKSPSLRSVSSLFLSLSHSLLLSLSCSSTRSPSPYVCDLVGICTICRSTSVRQVSLLIRCCPARRLGRNSLVWACIVPSATDLLPIALVR